MDDYSKYLCIFGGGAVRGYAYLGVLRAFEEIGFCPEKLSGSSVGAVFAAFSALDMPLNDIEKKVMAINFELFRDINISFGFNLSLSKGGVLLDWLREQIEKAFYKENYMKGQNKPVLFKDLKRDLILIATDLTNEVPFIFSKNTTPDCEVAMAIRASAAMPGLMTPITYENRVLADGDMLKGNPLWKLSKELYPDDLKVLELRLEGVSKENEFKNMLQYLNSVYSCMTNYSTDSIIGIYSRFDKFDYIKIDTKDLLLVNFNISKETKEKLAQIGYLSTMKFFKDILPKKKADLWEQYNFLREKISEIEKNIKKDDIKSAKILFGEIFEKLLNIEKLIERKVLNKINKLKKHFDEGITKGFLWHEKILNKKLLKSDILELKELLDKKCIELAN